MEIPVYAIIQSGGQQFKVAKDEKIRINKIPGKKGDKVEFEKVLLISDKETTCGTPFIDNATVSGVIIDQIKGKKVLIGKHKRRKNYQKITGFRPQYTTVHIKTING